MAGARLAFDSHFRNSTLLTRFMTEAFSAAGWMSNRGRQNVASYLALDLEEDWRQGADWFESCLLDYDVCSNWGNWVAAAGEGVSSCVRDCTARRVYLAVFPVPSSGESAGCCAACLTRQSIECIQNATAVRIPAVHVGIHFMRDIWVMITVFLCVPGMTGGRINAFNITKQVGLLHVLACWSAGACACAGTTDQVGV